jgi:hypothetical protein
MILPAEGFDRRMNEITTERTDSKSDGSSLTAVLLQAMILIVR